VQRIDRAVGLRGPYTRHDDPDRILATMIPTARVVQKMKRAGKA
jgi:hypothetical protein